VGRSSGSKKVQSLESTKSDVAHDEGKDNPSNEDESEDAQEEGKRGSSKSEKFFNFD